MIAIPQPSHLLVAQCRDCKLMSRCPSIAGGTSTPDATRCSGFVSLDKRHMARARKEALAVAALKERTP